MNRFLEVSIFTLAPFLINISLATWGKFWGFQEFPQFVLWANALGVVVWVAWVEWLKKSGQGIGSGKPNFWFQKNYYLLFSLQFLFFCIFPIRHMGYGDGILLLENVYLETQLFGMQITLDEIWEAGIHSWVFRSLDGDPRDSYRWVSTLAGFFYLLLALKILNAEKKSESVKITDILIFFSPTVLLLFYGYVENYTLVSLYLVITLWIGRSFLLNQSSLSNRTQIFLMAFLASFGATLHLVFGYMIFALIFFARQKSPSRKQFVLLSIVSGSIGVFWIGGHFLYFLVFSDPTANPSQSHVLTPPIYPWKRMISLNHFKEIFGVAWFSSSFPILVLLFSWTKNRKKTWEFWKRPENYWIVLSCAGFFLHGFVHNPMLGFPTDWDLFSFYALPLTYLAFLTLPLLERFQVYLIPYAVYSFVFTVALAYQLGNNPIEKEEDYRITIGLTQDYITAKKDRIQEIHPTTKKLYVKLDHFLFKAERIIQALPVEFEFDKRNALLMEISHFRNELEEEIQSTEVGKLQKKWVKSYLTKLTEFHHRFIAIRQAYTKYHLGKESSP